MTSTFTPRLLSFRLLAHGLCVVALLCSGAGSAQAARGQVSLSGGGTISSSSASADFSVELGDNSPLAFVFTDWGTDGGRTFTLDSGSADCLGDMFGGQTVRINAKGSDSAHPNESVNLQVFLVDGGAGAPSRMSLKVRQPNGNVAYFTPMKDLDSGTITVGCS